MVELDPRLLQRHPITHIPYWSGGVPKHPLTESWPKRAILYVQSVGLSTGTPKTYPLKPMIVVLTPKVLIFLKAKDLTLAQRVFIDTIQGVFSNILADPSTRSGPTGFIVLKGDGDGDGGSSANSMGKPTSSTKSRGEGASGTSSTKWDCDLAFQGPQAEMKPFLLTLMKLVCHARKLPEDIVGSTFSGSIAQQHGGVMVDLARGGEGSLLDTKLSYAPPKSSRDPRLAFMRLEVMLVTREAVADKFLASASEEEVAAALDPERAASVKGGAPGSSRGVAQPPAPPPPCPILDVVRHLQPVPVDYLSMVAVDAASPAAALYEPLVHVAAYWSGVVALWLPSEDDLAASAPAFNESSIMAACFVTAGFLYVACSRTELLRSVPLQAIRYVLISQKESRKQRPAVASAADGATLPSSIGGRGGGGGGDNSPVSTPAAGSNATTNTRVKVALTFAIPQATSSTVQHPVTSMDSGDYTATGGDAALAASSSSWGWVPDVVAIEFDSEDAATSFFQVLKSFAPGRWESEQWMTQDPEASSLRVRETVSALYREVHHSVPEGAFAAARQLVLPDGHNWRHPSVAQLWCPVWKRTADVELVAFRLRLFALYECYRPNKLALVDRVLWDRRGTPGAADEVLAALVSKYGPEPEIGLEPYVSALIDTEEDPLQRNTNSPAVAAEDVPRDGASVRSSAAPTGGGGPATTTTGRDGLAAPPSHSATLSPVMSQRSLARVNSGQSGGRMRQASFSSHGGNGPPLNSTTLAAATEPPLSRTQVLANLLMSKAAGGPADERTRGGPLERQVSSSTFQSVAATATSAGTVRGSTVGDVLRSYGFSTTYFDRFAAMYFPQHTRISSACDEPDTVKMFERLIHAYAPNEDALYVALLERADKSRGPHPQPSPPATAATVAPSGDRPLGEYFRAQVNVGMSPTVRSAAVNPTVAGTSTTPVQSNRNRPSDAALSRDYEPDEPLSRPSAAAAAAQIDASSVWGRTPSRYDVSTMLTPSASSQKPESSADATAMRRFRTMSKYGATDPAVAARARGVDYARRTYEESVQYSVAPEDLRDAVLEPLTASIPAASSSSLSRGIDRWDLSDVGSGIGSGIPTYPSLMSQDTGAGRIASLPPMFSGRRGVDAAQRSGPTRQFAWQ